MRFFLATGLARSRVVKRIPLALVGELAAGSFLRERRDARPRAVGEAWRASYRAWRDQASSRPRRNRPALFAQVNGPCRLILALAEKAREGNARGHRSDSSTMRIPEFSAWSWIAYEAEQSLLSHRADRLKSLVVSGKLFRSDRDCCRPPLSALSQTRWGNEGVSRYEPVYAILGPRGPAPYRRWHSRWGRAGER